MDRDQISFGPFCLDLGQRKLSFQGTPVRLGSRALDILHVLALANGDVVSKDQLLEKVWPGLTVEENNIQVHISALRKELDQRTKGESFVVTVPGRGYRLMGLERLSETNQSQSGSPHGPTIPGTSIAVLPFQNMSGDPEQEYFADGIVEDIITGLSRIKWLFVIARNSSFFYKGKAVQLKQIGDDLGVRYLMEGSVRKSGNRVRITAQLIEAQTGIHLWAERYDRSLDDIFAVQDEITMSVIGAIEPNLRKVEIERVKRKRPDSLDAYDLVLRALPFMRTRMVADAAEGVQAIADGGRQSELGHVAAETDDERRSSVPQTHEQPGGGEIGEQREFRGGSQTQQHTENHGAQPVGTLGPPERCVECRGAERGRRHVGGQHGHFHICNGNHTVALVHQPHRCRRRHDLEPSVPLHDRRDRHRGAKVSRLMHWRPRTLPTRLWSTNKKGRGITPLPLARMKPT